MTTTIFFKLSRGPLSVHGRGRIPLFNNVDQKFSKIRWITTSTDCQNKTLVDDKSESKAIPEPSPDNKNEGITTVDSEEIDLHASLASNWWSSNGTMKALHSLNDLRVPFIRDGLLEKCQNITNQRDTPKPLLGTKILEVGCGGGILSEPLSRLGASVTGLDASEHLITLARDHSAQSLIKNDLNYVHDTIEVYSGLHPEEFDAVVASEVIEHVENKELFLESCSRALKPNGSFFLTTINQTDLAWLGGIVIAEGILKIVPAGTHHWEKFISPRDLIRMLEKYNCKMKMVHGMAYLFLNNSWYWCADTSINYAVHAVKRDHI